MNKFSDAYGHEILDFWNGKRSYEIIERDDGYIVLSGGPRPYFYGYKAWALAEKKAIELANGKVLDIGCGAGRVSLYLQQKGYEVVALDPSQLAVQVCKLRGVKNTVCGDVFDFDDLVTGPFDTIVMFGGNFGLLGTLRKARSALAKLSKITSDNAVILASANDPHLTRNISNLEYQRRNKRLGKMPGQMRIRVRFDRYATEWSDYLLASRSEMAKVLKGTGWIVDRFIADDKSLDMYVGVIRKRH
ncbi:MAG: class I SAM-dependent methyltransferase [Rhabdochlamydiaceae bacterium]